jgi:hypothetical protein
MQPCKTNTDCYQGLVCERRRCQTGARVPWLGVACTGSTSGGARAYFEVPGAPNADEGDFFRLPFPNDVRRQNGRLDLTGFPTPGTYSFGVDPVQVYVDAIAASDTAWGTYGTVTFRFSGSVNITRANLTWVDVTAGAPEYGSDVELVFRYEAAPSAYVCANSLAVRPAQGRPLLPDHTYAILLRTGLTSAAGQVQRSANFEAVMASVAPSEAKLARAWEAFQPLRAVLSARAEDPSKVLVASVITVGDPRKTMAALAAAVARMPPPAAAGWVRCRGGGVSPCPQRAGERACGSGDANYDEYQALISLPIFQRGTVPYIWPWSGGDIDPNAVARKDVCMALSVPRSPMPAAGWPLVIYAHGTGASYRDHVKASVAGVLAANSKPSAVLGIDQVAHGTRRGTSSIPPDELFYNFLNPAVARGNPLQGAADQLGLARFAATLNLSAQESHGDAIKIDPSAIVFFGHSQGSTHGSLMLPYGDAFKGAVLSGNGAGLIHALLHKTEPVNVARFIPTLVQDEKLGVLGNFHPVLSLLQQWVEPADPVNFAAAVAAAPLSGHLPKHVFQTYGLGDTYAPPVTLATYALAGGFAEVTPDASVAAPDPIGKLVAAPAPFAGNIVHGEQRFTLGVRQYAPPAGADGHFVVYRTPSANADAVRFLSMAANGQIPQVGASP